VGSDFQIGADYHSSSMEIKYFIIYGNKWFNEFNEKYDKKFKYDYMVGKGNPSTSIIEYTNDEQNKKILFSHIGDEIVRLGLGYWIPYITGTGDVNIYLIIPYFIYENIIKRK